MSARIGEHLRSNVFAYLVLFLAVTVVPAYAAKKVKVPKNAVASKQIKDGQVKGVDVDSAQVQLRVGGSCPTGQAIRVVNVDGTVACEIDDAGSSGGGGAPTGAAGGDLTGTYPNPQLANLAVATAKLADNAVTTGKLGDGQVTIGKLSFDPATQAELDALATPGTVNQVGNPVDFTKLKGVPAGFADGTDDGGPPTGPAGGGLTGSYPNPTIAENAINSSRVQDDTLIGTDIDESTLTGLWRLGGNAGTNPATEFLGTTDNTALSLRVNNQRALRIVPDATSPSLIGGFSGNSVTSAVSGGTIAGGGAGFAGFHNSVTDDYGFVGGGLKNIAGDDAGTTFNNTLAAVVGGNQNSATGESSFIGGGGLNVADGSNSAIPGGDRNAAAGDYSLVGGRRAKNSDAAHDGVFLFGDSTDADFASAAANEFAVRASGGYRLFSSTDTTGANAPGIQIPAGSSTIETRGSQSLGLRSTGSLDLHSGTDSTPECNLPGGSDFLECGGIKLTPKDPLPACSNASHAGRLAYLDPGPNDSLHVCLEQGGFGPSWLQIAP